MDIKNFFFYVCIILCLCVQIPEPSLCHAWDTPNPVSDAACKQVLFVCKTRADFWARMSDKTLEPQLKTSQKLLF